MLEVSEANSVRLPKTSPLYIDETVSWVINVLCEPYCRCFCVDMGVVLLRSPFGSMDMRVMSASLDSTTHLLWVVFLLGPTMNPTRAGCMLDRPDEAAAALRLAVTHVLEEFCDICKNFKQVPRVLVVVSLDYVCS